jgi:hypothetical protein
MPYPRIYENGAAGKINPWLSENSQIAQKIFDCATKCRISAL